MSRENYWVVYFIEKLPPSGDSVKYKFVMRKSFTEIEDIITVRISRNVTLLHPNEEDIRKIAANSVQLHLYNKLSKNDYRNGEISITSYSTFKSDMLDEYKKFEVHLPKKGMGFID